MENTAQPKDRIQELLDGMSEAIASGDTKTFKRLQKELKTAKPISADADPETFS